MSFTATRVNGYVIYADPVTMLTSQVYDYLKRNPRRFKMSEEEILACFNEYGIPPHPKFVDFQLKYGGYCPEPEEMTFGIVTPLSDDFRHDHDKFNGLIRVDFVIDCWVQIGFWMDQNGMIYYDHFARGGIV